MGVIKYFLGFSQALGEANPASTGLWLVDKRETGDSRLRPILPGLVQAQSDTSASVQSRFLRSSSEHISNEYQCVTFKIIAGDCARWQLGRFKGRIHIPLFLVKSHKSFAAHIQGTPEIDLLSQSRILQ